MAGRRTYNTRQRQAIQGFMAAHSDRYLSVDDVFGRMRAAGTTVGRTTTYRTLEALVGAGAVAKVVSPGKGEALYRLIDVAHAGEGQMVCLSCGRVVALDCGHLHELAEHVHSEHGFSIELSRTVLYGTCGTCEERARG